jgi:hypothetical protein
MYLTITDIQGAASDKVLFDRLSGELANHLPPELNDDLGAFLAKLDDLSPGLRAMAATFQLDVSMALDDLGWHFANWHHRPYCEETSRGLWELGANEVAQVFDQAYQIVLPHWDAVSGMLATGFQVFSEWYPHSELEKALGPLNNRLWDICAVSPEFGLMRYWLDYARRFPERVVQPVR